ncbi:acyl carrier protein [Sneathiella chungangensis]|uniref:Acyl carrier protein n=1 Tax=Sneathiella chungangensis TaxID=1418234 RepID=A0A845MFV7_9PROT|nr:acyl carrier protein [Sneathiella chungangensis]MZR22913.1 acyl carrier protein [Sneathiella chungangensis]
MSRDEIYDKLREYLEDMFEVPPELITPDAQLYDDLDLDSIDAVDLVVKLQDLTGKKIPPDEFRTVRSVGDVVDRVHALLAA